MCSASLKDFSLTGDDVAFYQREGYLIPEQPIPEETFAKLKKALETRLELLGDKRPDFVPLPHTPDPTLNGKDVDNARDFFAIATGSRRPTPSTPPTARRCARSPGRASSSWRCAPG